MEIINQCVIERVISGNNFICELVERNHYIKTTGLLIL